MNVYATRVEDLMDLPGVELLPAERSGRLTRYHQIADRARCLGVGLLLRRVLGDEACQRIERDHLGKPFLRGGPHFNVSHGGNYAVLVVSDQGHVGIDVEKISPFAPEVAQRCMQDTELEWLTSRTDREQAFCALWTGKESVMKAAGLGMLLAPESFSVVPLGQQRRIVGSSSWYLKWRRLDGHMICAACTRPEPMTLQILSRAELV